MNRPIFSPSCITVSDYTGTEPVKGVEAMNPKFWAFVVVAATMIFADGASAAEKNSKSDWAARVKELAAPANGDVVFTAAGDTLWNHTIENNPDPGLQTLFQVMRGSDVAFMNFEQVLAD